MSKLTLRYFARFKGDTGYLRAVVRYDGHRKYLTTPIVITRTQLPRLKSFGRIIHTNDADALLDGRLLRYTSYIMQVAKTLVDNGTFAATSSADFAAMVLATKEKTEGDHARRSEAMAEATLKRKAEEAARRGHKLQSIDFEDLKSLIKRLKDTLTPAEYENLWKKGGEE